MQKWVNTSNLIFDQNGRKTVWASSRQNDRRLFERDNLKYYLSQIMFNCHIPQADRQAPNWILWIASIWRGVTLFLILFVTCSRCSIGILLFKHYVHYFSEYSWYVVWCRFFIRQKPMVAFYHASPLKAG